MQEIELHETTISRLEKQILLFKLFYSLGLEREADFEALSIQQAVDMVRDTILNSKLFEELECRKEEDLSHLSEEEKLSRPENQKDYFKTIFLGHYANFFQELTETQQSVLEVFQEMESERKRFVLARVKDDAYLHLGSSSVLPFIALFDPIILPSYTQKNATERKRSLLDGLFSQGVTSSPLRSFSNSEMASIDGLVYTLLKIKSPFLPNDNTEQSSESNVQDWDAARDMVPLVNEAPIEGVAELARIMSQLTVDPGNSKFQAQRSLLLASVKKEALATIGQIFLAMNQTGIADLISMYTKTHIIDLHLNYHPHTPFSSQSNCLVDQEKEETTHQSAAYFSTFAQADDTQRTDLHCFCSADLKVHTGHKPHTLSLNETIDIFPSHTRPEKPLELIYPEWQVLQQAYMQFMELDAKTIARASLVCAQDELLIAIQYFKEHLQGELFLPSFPSLLKRKFGEESSPIILFFLALYDESIFRRLRDFLTYTAEPMSFPKNFQEAFFEKYQQRLHRLAPTNNQKPRQKSPYVRTICPPPAEDKESRDGIEKSHHEKFLYWLNLGFINPQDEPEHWFKATIEMEEIPIEYIDWMLSTHECLCYFVAYPGEFQRLREKAPWIEEKYPQYSFWMALEDPRIAGSMQLRLSPMEFACLQLKHPPSQKISWPPQYISLQINRGIVLSAMVAAKNQRLSLFIETNLRYYPDQERCDENACLLRFIQYFLGSDSERRALLKLSQFIQSILFYATRFIEVNTPQDAMTMLFADTCSPVPSNLNAIPTNIELMYQFALHSEGQHPTLINLIVEKFSIYLSQKKWNFLDLLRLILSDTTSREIKKELTREGIQLNSSLSEPDDRIQTLFHQLFHDLQSDTHKTGSLIAYLNAPTTAKLLETCRLGGVAGPSLVLALLKVSAHITDQSMIILLNNLLHRYLTSSGDTEEPSEGCFTYPQLYELFNLTDLHSDIQEKLLSCSSIRIGSDDHPADLGKFLLELRRQDLNEKPIALAILQKERVSGVFTVLTMREIAALCKAYPHIRELASLYSQGQVVRERLKPLQLARTSLDILLDMMNISRSVYSQEEYEATLPPLCREYWASMGHTLTSEPLVGRYVRLSCQAKLPRGLYPIQLHPDLGHIIQSIAAMAKQFPEELPCWIFEEQVLKLFYRFGAYLPRDPIVAADQIKKMLAAADFFSTEEDRHLAATRLIENMPLSYFPKNDKDLSDYLGQIYRALGQDFLHYFAYHSKLLTQRIAALNSSAPLDREDTLGTITDTSMRLPVSPGLDSSKGTPNATPSRTRSAHFHDPSGSGISPSPARRPTSLQLSPGDATARRLTFQTAEPGTPPPSPGGSGKPG